MSNEMVRVWDIFVRVFHWTLVASFFIAYVTEDEVMWLHELTGYIILLLVIARVTWGFVGTKYARFSNFLTTPGKAFAYLSDSLQGRSKRYLGHNPAGGMMVIILLIMLGLTSWTGILLDQQENHASNSVNISIIKSAHADSDEEDEDENEVDEFLEEIHEELANLTLLLIFIHVAGVIFSGTIHHENLVRSMFTGMKRKE